MTRRGLLIFLGCIWVQLVLAIALSEFVRYRPGTLVMRDVVLDGVSVRLWITEEDGQLHVWTQSSRGGGFTLLGNVKDVGRENPRISSDARGTILSVGRASVKFDRSTFHFRDPEFIELSPQAHSSGPE